MARSTNWFLLVGTLALVQQSAKAAPSFVDRSAQLTTSRFTFAGTGVPESYTNNENYYDGDFADLNQDGYPDRVLGSRFGLLLNTGEGYMIPYAGHTNFLLRGMNGASQWGEDAFNWADIDGDGDLDVLSGGNGEPFVCQTNNDGYFTVKFNKTGGSALNIVNTDIDGDGDVDLAVAHTFCSDSACGGPEQFTLWVNDGAGNMTEEAAARGIPFTSRTKMAGAVSGDVDRDGDYDLILKNGTARSFVLARNDGTGHYALEYFALNDANASYGSGFNQAMQLGDIDDDGDLDFFSGMTGPHGDHPKVAYALFFNDGGGHFSEQSAAHFDIGTYDPAADFSAGVVGAQNAKLVDIDYDGDLDIAGLDFPEGLLTFFLNDGSGRFTFARSEMFAFPKPAPATGGDLDVADLDNDGSYDLWAGSAGGIVRELMSTFVAPDGLPADVPRRFAVTATPAGVTAKFALPSFAATARHFRVYRSSVPGLALKDRVLVATIGERHQDEALSAPISRHTTAAELRDPRVSIDGVNQTVSFIDATAAPGVPYFYSVTHIGAENDESASSPELLAVRPLSAPDTDDPLVEIASPTTQTWSTQPRIVAHLADASGIDPASVVFSFDKALGVSHPAGANLVDLATRVGNAVVIPIADSLKLPANTLVTLTITAADMNGNTTNKQVQFFTRAASTQPPTAIFTTSATTGSAPFTVELDASASRDAGGRMFAWEWYFGDSGTAFGRKLSHTFTVAGTYDVVLAARDNEGGVTTSKVTITVTGPGPACSDGETRGCYSGPIATRDQGVCRSGQEVCYSGTWSACNDITPTAESCTDDEDNDCDGAVDASDLDCGGTSGMLGDSSDPQVSSLDDERDLDIEDGMELNGGCLSSRAQPAAAALLSLLWLRCRRRRIGAF